MKISLSVFALAGMASTALAADAPKPPSPPSLCVRTQTIDDWRVLDARTIVVQTSPGKSYKVTFQSNCNHMKSSVLARILTRPTGPNLCLSRGDIILFGRGQRHADDSFSEEERCVIDSIAPYAEDEAKP